MRTRVIKNIKGRLDEIDLRSSLKFLITTDPEEYMDPFISVLYRYTRAKKGLGSKAIFFTETICAIGHAVRRTLKLTIDSSAAAKTGAFLLYSLDTMGVLEVGLGRASNGHNTYIITVLNDDAILKLWSQVNSDKAEKLPSASPYAPWISTKHDNGLRMVKTHDDGVLRGLTPETHPIVFGAINKKQATGWRINKFIYDTQLWAIRNKATAFDDIWNLQNPEAKTTKLRETKAIGEIAKRFLDKTFFHQYYCDFRGRIYSNTAYLNETGSDLARGLLLRDDKKAIGYEGFFWLMISIANNWGGSSGRDDYRKTDKIPLKDRFEWAKDNEEILLSYAEHPKVNQGWMKADKPWQFLAACYELMRLRSWQFTTGDSFNDYSYESHIEVFIDGLKELSLNFVNSVKVQNG